AFNPTLGESIGGDAFELRLASGERDDRQCFSGACPRGSRAHDIAKAHFSIPQSVSEYIAAAATPPLGPWSHETDFVAPLQDCLRHHRFHCSSKYALTLAGR